MDLIERLRKSAAHLRSTSRGGLEYEARLQEAAAAALEAAREDAERYRWIRSSRRTTAELEIVLNHKGGVLDAAIDHSRGKGVPG